MIHRHALLLIVGCLGLCIAFGRPAAAGGDEDAPAMAEQTVPEPADYRMDDYHGQTPATVTGGAAVTTAELRRLMKKSKDLLLIDVLPSERKPEGLPEGTLWMPKPRHNIPGSVWLPEVGRGALSPEVETYFRDNLERLTAGDRDRPMVIYCLARCWMSWNAARRAIGYGYRHVYWYRDGTDGWTAAGLKTQVGKPVPMPGAP